MTEVSESAGHIREAKGMNISVREGYILIVQIHTSCISTMIVLFSLLRIDLT